MHTAPESVAVHDLIGRVHALGRGGQVGEHTHRSCRLCTACSASEALTAKHTECSEDAWLIMMTFTPASRTVLKMVDAVPGTPTMPVPCTWRRRRQVGALCEHPLRAPFMGILHGHP